MTILEKLHFYHSVYRYRFHTEKTQLKNLLNLKLKSTTVIDVAEALMFDARNVVASFVN